MTPGEVACLFKTTSLLKLSAHLLEVNRKQAIHCKLKRLSAGRKKKVNFTTCTKITFPLPSSQWTDMILMPVLFWKTNKLSLVQPNPLLCPSGWPPFNVYNVETLHSKGPLRFWQGQTELGILLSFFFPLYKHHSLRTVSVIPHQSGFI